MFESCVAQELGERVLDTVALLEAELLILCETLAFVERLVDGED